MKELEEIERKKVARAESLFEAVCARMELTKDDTVEGGLRCSVVKAGDDTESMEAQPVSITHLRVAKKAVRRKTSMNEFSAIRKSFGCELDLASKESRRAAMQQKMMRMVIETLMSVKAEENSKYLGRKRHSFAEGDTRHRWQKGASKVRACGGGGGVGGACRGGAAWWVPGGGMGGAWVGVGGGQRKG